MTHRTSSLASCIVIAALLFGGASCIRISTGGGQGGIFVSRDRGATWQQRAFVRQEKKKTVNIAGTNVYDVAGPYTSGGVIYVALGDDGLYRTTNRGEQWELVLASKTDAIQHVALNAKNKNIVYAVIGSRVARTNDAGVTWNVLYIENRPKIFVTDITIDPFDPRRVYLVFSDGSINQSVDSGSSWSTFYKPESGGKVVQLLIHAQDTRVMTIVTENRGIMRTRDMGKTWVSSTESLKSFKGANNGIAVASIQNSSETLFYLSKFGLLRSTDGGTTWTEVSLLTDPLKTTIRTFAVDPVTPTTMYYSTATTLYSSIDGGKTWSTKSLPTPYVPSQFVIEQGKTPILYLGGIKQ